LHYVARKQSGENRSEESGVDFAGEISTYKSRNQPGFSRNGIGDITCQHRQHQSKGSRADVEHYFQPGRVREVRAVRSHRREGNGRGDKDASASDEWNCVRYAGQKMLAKLLEELDHEVGPGLLLAFGVLLVKIRQSRAFVTN